MSTLHWAEGRLIAFTKGALESVLLLCANTHVHGNAITMTSDERTRILSQSRSFAEQAYRVLAVAMREVAFFGLYPANKASKLNPVEALHYE